MECGIVRNTQSSWHSHISYFLIERGGILFTLHHYTLKLTSFSDRDSLYILSQRVCTHPTCYDELIGWVSFNIYVKHVAVEKNNCMLVFLVLHVPLALWRVGKTRNWGLWSWSCNYFFCKNADLTLFRAPMCTAWYHCFPNRIYTLVSACCHGDICGKIVPLLKLL